jgi:hypothetical protein
MIGALEDEAALDHSGNAVVKPVTVGLDPWEAHQLGGDDNTTNINVVIICHMQLRNYFGFFDLFRLFRPVPPSYSCPSFLFQRRTKRDRRTKGTGRIREMAKRDGSDKRGERERRVDRE